MFELHLIIKFDIKIQTNNLFLKKLIKMWAKFYFHTCHLIWIDNKCCMSIRAGTTHDPCDTPPVHPHIYPSPSRHGSATTFPTCFYFPWEHGEPGVEAALGWICANGERVHSPTHPFPVLSRSIIVKCWGWEPQSLPTPTPAASPSAAAKQPPASLVYPPIYTSIHTSINSSIYQFI